MSDNTGRFRLTSTQKKYLEQQLESVSRSFAIVIPYIDPPVRHYLAVAYLLCRIADNIEDCGQPHTWKMERFQEFLRVLREPQRAAGQLADWDRRSWPGLTREERQVMGVSHGLALWQMYAMIPDQAQLVLKRWISVMAGGMSQLGEPDKQPLFVRWKGIDVLETELDYNEYCFYVAGTVGALASELVAQQYALDADAATTLHMRAGSCGRSLQKTNIVKDFVEDVGRGVCYLPDTWLRTVEHAPLELRGADLRWKANVIADVLGELHDATDYVLALPQRAAGYRRACLLCLFSSYHTMLAAAQRHDSLFTSSHQIKISRTTMAQCISDSDKVLRNDGAIRQYCSHMAEKIGMEMGESNLVPKS
jgi:farnesyl-diphosphate farnesyltransferase